MAKVAEIIALLQEISLYLEYSCLLGNTLRCLDWISILKSRLVSDVNIVIKVSNLLIIYV